MQRTVPVLVAVTVLLGLAPTPGASPVPADANVNVRVDGLDGLVNPLEGGAAATVTVEYVVTPVVPTVEPTTVTLRAPSAPAWMDATFDPPRVTFHPGDALTETGGAAVFSAEVTMHVHLVDRVRAFVPGELEVEATAAENAPYPAASGTARVPVEAGYFAVVSLHPTEQETFLPVNGAVDVPLTLRGYANAATRVTYRVAENPAGFNVTLPEPVTLEQEWLARPALDVAADIRIEAPRNGFDAPAPVVVEAEAHHVHASGTAATVAEARLVMHPSAPTRPPNPLEADEGMSDESGPGVVLALGAAGALAGAVVAWSGRRR